MATDKRPLTPDAQGDPTHQTDNFTVIAPPPPAKKPHLRSASKSMADYLQTQHRIGQFNHYPLRKHRYIHLNIIRILDNLSQLYAHFFKTHWEKFARSVEKYSLSNTGSADHFALAANTYISHWLNDLYYSIRKSVRIVNPMAFAEKYHLEIARHADRYDPFLDLVLSAIKPTPVVGALADEIYIPVIAQDMDFSKSKPVQWKYHYINHTLFQTIHQTLELKKIVKMVNTNDDPTGRTSWLFDWPNATTAYAWFPMEGNYNDIDIAVAYVIGVACTPKVALPDIDEWRLFPNKTNAKNIEVDSYVRVVPRRKHGNSEYRILESQEIDLPNYYETDKTKFDKLNIGPIRMIKLPSTEDEGQSSDQPDPDYVPDSPRYRTRSTAGTDVVEKGLRVRVLDYIYHTQVIDRLEDATRFAAFKIQQQPQI